ncbi:MAG: hypothetical protein ACREQP_20500 [Candidatus Binatia bacterium]
MRRSKKLPPSVIAIVFILALSPLPLQAADPIEAAGVGVGLTVGNAIFVPVKALSVGWGLTVGALSFILSGGNADLTAQIWNDVTEGPYLITPELARTAVGERPELEKK